MASLTRPAVPRGAPAVSTGSSRHVEMRDSYGTDIELPADGQNGRPGEPGRRRMVAAVLATEVRADPRPPARLHRRAHVVSEPLSDYRRWTPRHRRADWSDAGRRPPVGCRAAWVSSIAFPRQRLSTWLDDRLVLFPATTPAAARNVDYVSSTDPHDIAPCARRRSNRCGRWASHTTSTSPTDRKPVTSAEQSARGRVSGNRLREIRHRRGPAPAHAEALDPRSRRTDAGTRPRGPSALEG